MRKLYDLLMEPTYRQMMIEMGGTDEEIYRIMRKRVFQALLVFVMFASIYFMTKSIWFVVIALVLSLIIYFNSYKQMKTRYRVYSFEKELEFSKFARLIGPYLKKNDGNTPLYGVFNKVLPRLSVPMQKEVYHLMSEMVTNPNDVGPFISFSKRMGDSDFAHAFMVALYDYQSSTNDITVIDELVLMANKALMKNIDEIISFKLSKFRFVPTLFTASIMFILLGFFVAMFIDTSHQIGSFSQTVNK